MNHCEEYTIQKVINGGYCIGCGACATVEEALSIGFDQYGQLMPHGQIVQGSSISKLCPFSATRNEYAIGSSLFGSDDAKFDERVGYYREIYMGHVAIKALREKGGSGGFVTWLLIRLLEGRLIDGVIHVKRSDRDSALFDYGVSTTVEDVIQSAKSKYYPASFDQAIKDIKGDGKKYAFVGVPCFVKAIRLLCEFDDTLSSQVKYVIGLFCGHMKSAAYATFISRQLIGSRDELKAIDFRVKTPLRPANQYSVSVEALHGNKVIKRMSPVTKLYGMDWGLGYFKPKACDWCDDIVGELADVSSGDAWLPEYINDTGGNNVIIVRSPSLQMIIEEGLRERHLKLDIKTPEEVYASQAGNYRHRREGLKVRVDRAKRANLWHPKKRDLYSGQVVPESRCKIYLQREKLSRLSHQKYFESGGSPLVFGLKMMPHELTYYFLNGRLLRGFAKAVFQLLRVVFNLLKYKLAK